MSANEQATLSELFTDESVKNAFITRTFSNMKSLGFCGLMFEADTRELTLFKDRTTFYEPFGVQEFRRGTRTVELFESITETFDIYEVSNDVFLGFNGFTREEMDRRISAFGGDA